METLIIVDRHTTDNVYRVYVFIRRCIKEHGEPPTMREIGLHCFMSHAYAIEVVDVLENQGYVKRIPRKSRGIILVKDVDLQPFKADQQVILYQ